VGCNSSLPQKMDGEVTIPSGGYWGPITASTEWCERNYQATPYIAEFYNTLSNFPGIILAFIGLIYSINQKFERRFSVLHLSTIALGIGSILFHATLQHAQQQSDETPMVWVMLLHIYVLYSPDWHYRSTMPTFLFLYGTIFAVLHSQLRFVVGFQLHYVFLALLCLPRMYKYYIHTTDPLVRNLAHRYIMCLVLGAICWLVDRNLCHLMSNLWINPQGHALWHIFTGFNSYFGTTFLQFCRAQQLDWSPKLCYLGGVLPYVKVKRRKET
jgi:dihydroceramidase